MKEIIQYVLQYSLDILKILFASLIVIYGIFATLKASEDNPLKVFGIIALFSAIMIFTLEVITHIKKKAELDQVKTEKQQAIDQANRIENEVNLLGYKMINEKEIQEQMKKLVEPETNQLFSSPLFISREVVGTEMKGIELAYKVDNHNHYSFVVFGTKIPGSLEFAPMIPAKNTKTNELYFIAVLVAPKSFWVNNEEIRIISKDKGNRFKSETIKVREIEINDLAVNYEW